MQSSGNYKNNNSAESPSMFRRLQHTLPFRLLIIGFRFAAKYLPVWFLRISGIPFVILFITFNLRNFLAIIKNIKNITPDASLSGSMFSAFQVFTNYSYYLIDLFHLSHDISRINEYKILFKGREILNNVFNENKGVILLTFHLGNWELGGLVLALSGKEVHVVYSPDSSLLLESQRSLMRSIECLKEVGLKAGEFSSIKLLNILKEKGIAAFQGDRLLFDSGAPIQFFNKQALFPKGPVKLALISDSVIVPVFVPMTGYKAYKIIIEEPIIMEKHPDSSIELKYNLERVVRVLEKHIKEYPTQWFTFMPFWLEDK